MWLKVNGKTMQNSRTSNMIFDLPAIISSVTQYMSLMPGDIICTGTPAGVGHAMVPPQYLNAGDLVEFGIEGLGDAGQNVVA
jgi:2-keto-4-pentenoate hydratase/2-oxohepta-3-ene-1,7-dioic acid hydratase in catechol pathway